MKNLCLFLVILLPFTGVSQTWKYKAMLTQQKSGSKTVSQTSANGKISINTKTTRGKDCDYCPKGYVEMIETTGLTVDGVFYRVTNQETVLTTYREKQIWKTRRQNTGELVTWVLYFDDDGNMTAFSKSGYPRKLYLIRTLEDIPRLR